MLRSVAMLHVNVTLAVQLYRAQLHVHATQAVHTWLSRTCEKQAVHSASCMVQCLLHGVTWLHVGEAGPWADAHKPYLQCDEHGVHI